MNILPSLTGANIANKLLANAKSRGTIGLFFDRELYGPDLILGQFGAEPPSTVDRACDNFQVFRINTPFISAQVVNLHSVRDGADKRAVRKAMSVRPLVIDREVTVSVFSDSSIPVPASSFGVNIHSLHVKGAVGAQPSEMSLDESPVFALDQTELRPVGFNDVCSLTASALTEAGRDGNLRVHYTVLSCGAIPGAVDAAPRFSVASHYNTVVVH